MKNKFFAVVIIGLMVITSYSFAAPANFQESKDDSCCLHCCASCCHMKGCEDIEMKVENIEGGVVIKITSKKEEVAKKIQEMQSKMIMMCAHMHKKCAHMALKGADMKAKCGHAHEKCAHMHEKCVKKEHGKKDCCKEEIKKEKAKK